MASIEGGFAKMIGSVSGGFSNSIMGQASYINQLQQGGASSSSSAQALGGMSKAQIVQKLQSDPAFQQQAMRAMQNNPSLLQKAVRELAAHPDLARALPPAMKQFFQQAIMSGAANV